MTTLACSSCFFGEDSVRYAYYLSAVVMFLLPLLMVGGTFRFLSSNAPQAPRREAGPVTRRRPVLFATMGSGALMLIVPILQSHDDPTGGALPVLAEIPRFELRDHRDRPLGTEQLARHAWIANFVFTRCPTVCPQLTRRMAELQKRTAHLGNSRLVSFSIDPGHDTPAVLADFAANYEAGPRWSFVTGPIDAMRSAVEEGLRVRMGDAGGTTDVGSVLHGTRFVLVDGKGRIRGYYDVSSDAGFDKLARDLERLAPGTRG